MKTIPLDSQDIRLITYIPGGGGNFLQKVITDFFTDTVKIKDSTNSNFKFSKTGHAHNLEKYIQTFHLSRFMQNNPGKTINDYNYEAKIIRRNSIDGDIEGKLIVIRCDLGEWCSQVFKVLERFPNAKMVRIYAGTFTSRLIAITNLYQKLNMFEYKNAIFDKEFMEYIKSLGGDLDEKVIKHLILTFEQDFQGYTGTWGIREPYEDERVYNIEFGSLLTYKSFYHEMTNLAKFFDTTINDKEGLKLFYDKYHSLQSNYKYATINKDSKVSDDDLIGQALIRYYEEEK